MERNNNTGNINFCHNNTHQTEGDLFSNQLSNLLLENVPIGIEYYSPDGCLKYINLVGAGYFAAQPNDLIGKKIEEFVSEPRRSQLLARLQKISWSMEKDQLEEKITIAGSCSQWVLSQGQPLFDSNHQLMGVEFITRNITTEMETETSIQNLLEDSVRFLVVIQDERIVYASREIKKIEGLSLDDVLQHKRWLAHYIHPDDIQSILNLYRKNENLSFKPGVADFRAIHHGEIQWMQAQTKEIVFHGKPAHMVACVEITERKKIEESHQQEVAYLAAFQEIIMGLYPNLDLETSLKAILHNAISLVSIKDGFIATYEKLSGEVVVQVGLGVFLDEKGKRYKESDSPIFARLSELLKPETLSNIPDNHPLLKNRGNHSITLFPIMTADQIVIGIVGLVNRGNQPYNETQMDILNHLVQFSSPIIENEHLHLTLKKEEEKLQKIIDSTIEGIILINSEHKIIEWNPAQEKMSGISRLAAVGSDFFIILKGMSLLTINAQQTAQIQLTIQMILQSPGTKHAGKIIQIDLPHKDGSQRHIQISFFKIEGDNGPLVGMATRDITEIHRMENQLIDTQKMAGIGTLASGIAHEINTPLQVITGTSEILIRDINSNKLNQDTLIRKLNSISRSSWRIAEIIRSLQDYTRPTPHNIEEEDINGLIQDVLFLVENQFKNKHHIKINSNLDPQLPKMICERNKIFQVLINLMNNAQDAMPGGGEIQISTYYTSLNERIVIEISDTGTGIQSEIMDKIYDPFFTTKPLGQGVGLGLSIVKGIVRSHQGTINVENKKTSGTTFTLSFPRLGPVSMNPSNKPKKMTGRFDE